MTLHIGGYSVVFGALALIVITAYFAFLVVNTWAIVRILRRVGYSGWWAMVGLVPFLNVLFFWYFAFWGPIDKAKIVAPS